MNCKWCGNETKFYVLHDVDIKCESKLGLMLLNGDSISGAKSIQAEICTQCWRASFVISEQKREEIMKGLKEQAAAMPGVD